MQRKRPEKNNNRFLLGITAHNMGVVSILMGRDYEALPYLEEAVALKRDAFGASHPELAVSLDELGIQLFAREKYSQALDAFNESKHILSSRFGPDHPRLCVLLNNIACCSFCMSNTEGAEKAMNAAHELQQKRNSDIAAKADLDLLRMAILLNNYGYLKVNAKKYEEARSCFEEALLVCWNILFMVALMFVLYTLMQSSLSLSFC